MARQFAALRAGKQARCTHLVEHGYAEQPLVRPESHEALATRWEKGMPLSLVGWVGDVVRRVVDSHSRSVWMLSQRDEGLREVEAKVTCAHSVSTCRSALPWN